MPASGDASEEVRAASIEFDVTGWQVRYAPGDAERADASMVDLIAQLSVGEADVRTVAPGFEPGGREVSPIL
jgi:hypothetical protein